MGWAGLGESRRRASRHGPADLERPKPRRRAGEPGAGLGEEMREAQARDGGRAGMAAWLGARGRRRARRGALTGGRKRRGRGRGLGGPVGSNPAPSGNGDTPGPREAVFRSPPPRAGGGPSGESNAGCWEPDSSGGAGAAAPSSRRSGRLLAGDSEPQGQGSSSWGPSGRWGTLAWTRGEKGGLSGREGI